MDNRLITVIFLLLAALLGQAQQKVTLWECHLKAIETYPLTSQEPLLSASRDLEISRLNKNYLPAMNINGQAHYQTDVTKIPVQEIPQFGVEPLSKDWYIVTLDVQQVLYDGSSTTRHKDLEEVNYEIDKQNLAIDLYQLKVRINQVYFSILLLNEQLGILQLHLNTLEANLETVDAGVRNGNLLSSNADVLKAEILQVHQSIDEVTIQRDAAISALNRYTDMGLNAKDEFLIPEVGPLPLEITNNRPEYRLFSIQDKQLEMSKNLAGSKLLPRFSAFGQAGYGRPGYDMLKNSFDDFYMIGARLTWQFWDWNKTRKEKEILTLKQDILRTRQETYDHNILIELESKFAAVKKAEKFIQRDQELIGIRERISESASSQLENGMITSSEYLTELNAASKAKLDLEVHKIELVKARLEAQSTLGNL